MLRQSIGCSIWKDEGAGDLAFVPMSLLSTCAAAIAVVREDGVVLFRNEAGTRLMNEVLGTSPEIGQSIVDWDQTPAGRERVSIMRRLAREGKHAVVRDIFNGEQVLSHLRLMPRRTSEELARFLIVHERACGQVRAADFCGQEFIEPSEHLLGPLDSLSAREVEVLALIGEGLNAPEIAARIFRSEETVNTHKASILKKLACHHATQLALIAYRAGLKYEDGQHLTASRQARRTAEVA